MFAVVNHLHLNVPPEQIAASAQGEGLALLKSLPGFKGFELVKEADDRLIVILFWETAADASHGAGTFGPTWFAKHIAPHLASDQQRTVGPVLLHYAA
jgi:hypothetical protein